MRLLARRHALRRLGLALQLGVLRLQLGLAPPRRRDLRTQLGALLL